MKSLLASSAVGVPSPPDAAGGVFDSRLVHLELLQDQSVYRHFHTNTLKQANIKTVKHETDTY